MNSNTTITPISKERNIIDYLEGRYILSYVLSFLDEKDGVNILRTNKRWYHRVLPIFRVVIGPVNHDSTACITSSLESSSSSKTKTRSCPYRYRFCVLPVQDSYVLLQRLNTKRLSKRIVYYNKQQSKVSSSTCNDVPTLSSVYPHNMTTDEIAWYEWQQQQQQQQWIHLQHHHPRHPCHLELLRYNLPLSSTIPPSISSSNIDPSFPSIPTLIPGVTLLVSYPRSGNTLLRTLLERITNVVTGSDTRPDRTLSQALSLEHNLVGEGITSSLFTSIVKSHFPERSGYLRFKAKRVILLVRNPYDAMDSYWNMCCTNTHTQTVQESIYEKYAVKFKSLTQHEIQTWIRFHAYWMNPFLQEEGTGLKEKVDDDEEAKTLENTFIDTSCKTDADQRQTILLEEYDSGIPVLVVRYEDLVMDTLKTMAHVLSFILQKDEQQQYSGNNDDISSLDNLHPFWKMRLYYGLGLSLESCYSNTTTTTTPPTTHDHNSVSLSIEQTMTLGSYSPRIHETPIQDNISCCSTASRDSSKKYGLLIGKSLAKKRYSQDTLQYMHDISTTLEKNVLGDICCYHNHVYSLPSISWLQLFGYDMCTQHFPINFCQSQHYTSMTHIIYVKRKKERSRRVNEKDKNQTSTIDRLVINKPNEGIRGVFDEFGRAMTDWRKGETLDDTQPFPTTINKI